MTSATAGSASPTASSFTHRGAATGRALALLAATLLLANGASAARLAGRVLDWNGKPTAGALVSVVPGPTPASTWPRTITSRTLATSTTDRRGAFSIDGDGVEDGDHVLLISSEGRPPTAVERWRFSFGASHLPEDLDLRLSAPARVAGIVLDQAGVPVPDVLLRVAAMASDTSAVVEGRSDAHGRFVFDGLPMFSKCDVRAEARDGAAGVARAFLDATRKNNIAIVLVPSRVVSGSIRHRLSGGDEPVAHARLVVLAGLSGRTQWHLTHVRGPGEQAWIASEARTEEDGTFRLCTAGEIVVLAEPGWGVSVLSTGPNWARACAPRCVRVHLADGRPAVGAEVGWSGVPDLARTDVDGFAVLPDLVDGTIHVRHGDLVRRVLPAVEGRESLIEIGLRRRITGRVLLADGRSTPMRGALVLSGSDPALVTATDEAGAYSTSVREADLASAQVVALHGGRSGWAGVVEGGAIDVEVQPGCHLAVETGRQMAGCVVVADSDALPLPRVVGRVGSDGWVRLRDVPPGPWSVLSCSEGGVVANGRILASRSDAHRLEPLHLRQPMHLRCTDEDGRPVEGAELSLEVPLAIARGWDSFEVATDRDGRASFTLEPSIDRGCVMLTSWAEARVVEVTAWRHGFAAASREMTSGSSEQLTLTTLPMTHAMGTVRSASGVPISDADVCVTVDSTGWDCATTTVDGLYAIRGLGGPGARAHVGAPGFLPLDGRPLSMADESVIVTDFVLEQGIGLEGTLVRSDGTPVAGASVVVECSSPHHLNIAAETDERGAFRVEGVPRDAYCSVKSRPAEVVALPGGGRVFEYTPGPVVTGRVALGGEPVEGATIDCSTSDGGSVDAISRVDGSFEARARPRREGPFDCWASTTMLASSTDPVVVNADVLASGALIDLHPRSGSRIRVLAADDGTPIAGAMVMVEYDEGDGSMLQTDPLGMATLLLDEDDYATATIDAPGFERGGVTLDSPGPDPTIVALERHVIVSGRVIDAAGEPAVGAWLDRSMDGRSCSEGDVDPDGHFAIAMLPGLLRLAGLRDRDGFEESPDVVVQVGSSGARDIVLKLARTPTGSVRVKVVGAGAPRANALVELEWVPESDRLARFERRWNIRETKATDQAGVATFEEIPHGWVSLWVEFAQRIVEVAPSQITDVVIEATP